MQFGDKDHMRWLREHCSVVAPAPRDARLVELEAACWQTQAELDRCAQDLERLVRRLDALHGQAAWSAADGRRAAELDRGLERALRARRVAEVAAGAAADALIEVEESL